MGPENEEMPTIEVNLASRFINVANIAGAGNWERKKRAKECSSDIGTGFSGGGLRSFARLGKYVGYLGEFTLKQNW